MKKAPEEMLVRAREAIRNACFLAVEVSPQALDRCGTVLERAHTYLAAFSVQDGWNPECHEEWKKLQAELVRFGMLLENAAGFYAGWLRLRGSLSGGYTARGEPAPVEPAARFSAEG